MCHAYATCINSDCSDDHKRVQQSGLEVIKLEYSLRLKIKRNDWLFADTCPQAANHCALFGAWIEFLEQTRYGVDQALSSPSDQTPVLYCDNYAHQFNSFMLNNTRML